MPTLGLVVEGTFDAAIYSAFVNRLAPGTEIVVRDMGGISQLLRLLPAMLVDLEHAIAGQAVDEVMVLRDADGKNIDVLERAMRDRLIDHTFSFRIGIEFNIAVQTVDTWLLADPDAITAVALERGGTELDVQGELPADLETEIRSKQLLSRFLCRSGLPFTAPVCGTVAMRANLDVLRSRCSSFRAFEEKLLR